MNAILQQIKFKDDFLEVVKVAGDGAVAKVNHQYWVSVKRVCQNLGIDFNRQHQKIKSDAESFEPQLIEVKTNGGVQKVFCIPLSKLNGWLFSINPNRVKPEVREKLIAYKKECFDVLFNHFIKKAQKPTKNLFNECDEQAIKELIKRSDIVRGYQGQIAKLENELARKQSEIKNLELKLQELSNPFESEPVKMYIELSQKKIKSYEQGFLNLKKELLAQIKKVQEELLALEEILECHVTEEKDFLYIAGNIIPKK